MPRPCPWSCANSLSCPLGLFPSLTWGYVCLSRRVVGLPMVRHTWATHMGPQARHGCQLPRSYCVLKKDRNSDCAAKSGVPS